MSSPDALEAVDFLDNDAVADPAGFFDRVRERGPVVWSTRHHAWIVLGHPELDEAFRDHRLSTERMDAFRARLSGRRAAALERAIELLDGWMLFHEPPTHTRLRSPLSRSFTPKAVSGLADRVDELVAGYIDAMRGRSRVDLVDALSHPLPAAVIAELFGVPADERGWLASWSEKFGVVVFGATGRDDYEKVAREAGEELSGRLGDLMDRYRREPEDNLLSLLLSTEGQEDGLTTIEILGACSILLFAGHDTTSSFLGSATVALLEHGCGDEFRELGHTADLEPAIEELLRFEPPAKAMMRTVAMPHQRGDCLFERGQSVFMAILGANRDEGVFDRPHQLDLAREPNPHLTFGYGHHFCLGAALARLEARTALPALFEAFPAMSLDGPVTWKPTISDRSAASIPLKLR